jgi:hypothetical protein
MMEEPKCSKRNCIHFLGIRYLDKQRGESSEVTYCLAFPNGIPNEIAYGDNEHLRPVEGDNGIQFEKDDLE